MKTILLTGATRGVGLAMAHRLLGEGYRLVGVGRTLSEGYQELLARHPQRGFFQPFDLAHIEGIHELVSRVVREHGPLYGVINNAAIGLDGVLATMHATEIDLLLKVNLHAPITLIKYASRSMLLQRQGRIINISSITAASGFIGLSVYGASKAGLEGLSRSLSRELGRVGITVNCIAPGFMETDMTRGMAEEQMATIRRRAPLGLATPAEVAGCAAYLLSDEAAHITGTVLTLDGGGTA